MLQDAHAKFLQRKILYKSIICNLFPVIKIRKYLSAPAPQHNNNAFAILQQLVSEIIF